jgi:hypothetical protein
LALDNDPLGVAYSLKKNAPPFFLSAFALANAETSPCFCNLEQMKFRHSLVLSFIIFSAFSFTADFTEVCGSYYGEKDDYATSIKLYDDSTFTYQARREFPFEVSEGVWTLSNDTITLNSIPCPDPDALTHVPVRTYHTFSDAKYLYKDKTLTPIAKGKLKKSEVLAQE